MELPFLIRHGALVWVSILGLLALAGALGAGRSAEPKKRALFGALALALGVGVFYGVGELVESSAVRAATPFHRASALRQYESELWETAPSSEGVLTERLALARMSGDCLREVGVLHEHRQMPELLEAVEQCDGARVHAGRMLDRAGRFAEASDELARAESRLYPIPRDVRAHLLAGQWERAAELRAWSRQLESNPTAPDMMPVSELREMGLPTQRERRERRAEARECLALWMEVRAGSSEALEELGGHREGAAPYPCTLLLADVSPVSSRQALLTTLRPPEGREAAWLAFPLDPTPALMQLEAGGEIPEGLREGLLRTLQHGWRSSSFSMVPPPGLVSAVLDDMGDGESADPEREAVRALLRVHAACVHSAAESNDVAARLADRGIEGLRAAAAMPDPPEDLAVALRAALEVRAWIAMRAGEPEEAERILSSDGVQMRGLLSQRLHAERDSDPAEYLAWVENDMAVHQAVADRDADALASVLRLYGFHAFHRISLFEVAAARLAGDGDALADWLRYGRNRDAPSEHVGELLVSAAAYCLAGRRIGADEVSGVECERARRIGEAWLGREAAIGVAVLDAL